MQIEVTCNLGGGDGLVGGVALRNGMLVFSFLDSEMGVN